MVPEMDVPAHVLRFLEENIETVPQLETLLMMSEARDRDWLVADVATRNYISEHSAEEVLSALRRRGLVSAGNSPLRFRFAPQDEQSAALVEELAQYYRTNLSRIATFIHSRPSASIKEFARAFDLKKDR